VELSLVVTVTFDDDGRTAAVHVRPSDSAISDYVLRSALGNYAAS